MLNRAYSLFEIKAIDDEKRVIEGFTSTPSPDRGGDVLDPKGASFSLPLPLLWQHRHDQPIGEVFEARVTKDGIWIKAQIAKDVLPFIDQAWALIKAKLVRGFSVGWKPLEPPTIKGDSFRFAKWLWVETSAVTIPMNGEATIARIKSIDAEFLPAALGTGDRASVHPAGVTAPRVAIPTRKDSRSKVKTYSEQIKEYAETRAASDARRQSLLSKASDEGRTLEEGPEETEYDELTSEIEKIDKHLVRLRAAEKSMAEAAKPVAGESVEKAAESRGGASFVRVSDQKLPPGIGFARSVMCQVEARLDQRNIMEVAKARYPSDTRLHQYLQYKAAVPAGTTTNDPWASPLVDPANLAGEFIEFLRPKTIVDRFGTNGIPSLQRVPFNVRIVGQSTGGVAGWTGQGRAKPVTSFGYNAVTLLYTKIAAIAVITEELARFSTPSAEARVRDSLTKCVVERLDIDFVDPAQAAVSGVNPASITNGLTALSSAGTSADNVRTDLVNLLSSFVENNQDPSGLVLIMPTSLALGLSIMTNTLGQSEFPDVGMSGGKIKGIPVLTSQYAANQSGAGNLVIAVNTNEVFLADDGQVKVDASREASIEMSDAPLGNSGTPTASSVSVVSMYQTNSIALRAERFVNWAKARAEAVVYMDDVNWGSVGSP